MQELSKFLRNGLELTPGTIRGIEQFKQKYAINLVFADAVLDKRSHTITTSLNPREAYVGVQLAIQEFAKYPPEYIRSSKLSQIILVKSIRGDNEELLGRWVEGSNIYVKVDLEDQEETRKTMHHELDHQAKNTHCSGQGVRIFLKERHKLSPTTWQDIAWNNRMRRERVRYLGKEWQTNDRRQTKGFANDYARVDIDEDQATIVEELMVKPKNLATLCAKDSLLASKVASVKKEMERRTNGKMNEAYFADLSAGKVKEGYWDKR